MVVTPDHHTAWESWMWSGTAPNYHAAYTVKQDLFGSGWGAGIHAAGCSLIGGLIRGWELASSPPAIHHTLAVLISTTAATSPEVWPAVAEDSGLNYTGSVPLGTLLALDPSADVDTLATTAEGRAVGHALQDYGAYVIDTAGTTPGVGVVLDPLSTTAPQAANIGTDLAALVAKLLVVANSADATPGGGAQGAPRRAAMAPPL